MIRPADPSVGYVARFAVSSVVGSVCIEPATTTRRSSRAIVGTMSAGAGDHARVTFPANPIFARVGRVAASGLALRLGFDVAKVENLRLAVDAAIRALGGEGTITLCATWRGNQLEVLLSNPVAESMPGLEVDVVTELVDEIHVDGNEIRLLLT